MLSLILVGALASAAYAQAPAVAIDAFVEQRVVEELAADGTILSRLGVALDVESVGEKLLVSLVDPTTKRVVASTKIDSVPADREAAVALVTQVVTTLVVQLGHAPPPATPPPAEPVAPSADLPETKAQRDDREARETAFREEALSFGDHVAIAGSTTAPITLRIKDVYKGDRLRRRLDGPEFYRLVGRPDLAEEFARNRRIYKIGLGVGLAGLVGGAVLAMYGFGPNYPGSFATRETEEEFDDRHFPYKVAGVGLIAAGCIAVGIGVYHGVNATPLSEEDIYHLAAMHNAKLRAKYRLPASARAMPYVDEHGGGMLVSGQF